MVAYAPSNDFASDKMVTWMIFGTKRCDNDILLLGEQHIETSTFQGAPWARPAVLGKN